MVGIRGLNVSSCVSSLLRTQAPAEPSCYGGLPAKLPNRLDWVRPCVFMSRLERIGDWQERARLAIWHAEKLADTCQVSSSQLRRFFAARFGESPQRWLDELRLWEAARLLCCTTLAVKCISIDLGFADESHFCRRFRAYFGCTASEFANRFGIQLSLATPLSEFAWVARQKHVPAALPLGVIAAPARSPEKRCSSTGARVGQSGTNRGLNKASA